MVVLQGHRLSHGTGWLRRENGGRDRRSRNGRGGGAEAGEEKASAEALSVIS